MSKDKQDQLLTEKDGAALTMVTACVMVHIKEMMGKTLAEVALKAMEEQVDKGLRDAVNYYNVDITQRKEG